MCCSFSYILRRKKGNTSQVSSFFFYESGEHKRSLCSLNQCLSVSNFYSFFSLRRQEEAELRLIEEETAKRVEDAIKRKVDESLNKEEIMIEIRRRLEDGRKKLVNEVAAQLEKEKESALIESKQKEASYFCLIICCYPMSWSFSFILAVTCEHVFCTLDNKFHLL